MIDTKIEDTMRAIMLKFDKIIHTADNEMLLYMLNKILSEIDRR